MMKTTPFYSLALSLFTQTQQNQIQKGLEKYPEPFNPRSWTPEQLLDHALQETVDLTHYLVGLKTLLDDKDNEIKKLKNEVEDLKKHLALKRGTKETNEALDNLDVGEYIYVPVGRLPKKSPFEEQYQKPPYADLDD